MIKWLVIFIGCIAVTGCSSSDNNNVTDDGLDIASYFDEQGDVITFNDHLDATYSNGSHATVDSITKEYYGQIGSIPSTYAYSGDISAPYLLRVTTEDDQIDGFKYSSMQKEEIVDDDLDTFKRIDAQTKTGIKEPDNVDVINVGDKFTYSENSTLFDSTSAQAVGNTVESGTFTVVAKETLSVPAGTYDSVKIDFDLKITTSLSGITDTAVFTGSSWFDATQGTPLKIAGTTNMTLNAKGLSAVATSERVLADYQSATPANGSNIQSASIRSGLTRSSIVRQILQTQLVVQGY